MPDMSILAMSAADIWDMSILDISIWSMAQIMKRLSPAPAGLGIQPAGISARSIIAASARQTAARRKPVMTRNLLLSPGKVNTPDVADTTGGTPGLLPLPSKSGGQGGVFGFGSNPQKLTPPNHFWFEGVSRRVSPF